MTQEYVHLREQLQCAQREAASLRQRCTQGQVERDGLKEQLVILKQATEQLKESNNKLSIANRRLTQEKEVISNQCSTQVSEIKEEISRKQQLLAQMRESISPSKMDYQLAVRQVKQELTLDYGQKLEAKQRRINELTNSAERSNRNHEIDMEKHRLRVQQLQRQLKQAQMKHQDEIREYSRRLNALPQVVGDSKEALRRAKRDADEMRIKWQFANSQLQAALEDKAQVRREYNKYMNELKKQKEDEYTELTEYKNEINRLNQQLNLRKDNRDQVTVRERDREVKRLRSEIEELRDEMSHKERKISDLEVERSQLQGRIRGMRVEGERDRAEAVTTAEEEKDKLQRELHELRSVLERTKRQNLDLSDRIYEMSNTQISKKMDSNAITRSEEQIRAQLRKQLIETRQFKEVRETIEQRQKTTQEDPSPPTKDLPLKQQRYEAAFRTEQGKVKDILMRYVQVKKRCEKAERKLEKANSKIVELLQNKIALGSPKASHQQRFDFTVHDTQEHSGAVRGDSRGRMAHQAHQYHHARNFLSPQQRPMRIEEGSNNMSYYEKSLKLRTTNRFRDVQCSNHDGSQEEQ